MLLWSLAAVVSALLPRTRVSNMIFAEIARVPHVTREPCRSSNVGCTRTPTGGVKTTSRRFPGRQPLRSDENCGSRQMKTPSPQDLCAGFVRMIPVTGASISLIDRSGRQSSLSSSDTVAARIDELQFQLGEGPQWDAVKTRSYVMIPNLDGDDMAAWPIFAQAMEYLPARALFTLPLLMGAATVGAVTLYNDEIGQLSRQQFREAVAIAASITWRAVHGAIRSADLDDSVESETSPALRREVHQATGIIVAQLDISATAAFSRLQAHAFATNQNLQDLAHDVVANRVDFRTSEE